MEHVVYVPNGPVVVIPNALADASFEDLLDGYVQQIIACGGPHLVDPQFSIVTATHTLAVKLKGGDPVDNFGWMPSFLDVILGDHANDVVRSAAYIAPADRTHVVFIVWDAAGSVFCGAVRPGPFGPMAIGHGHLPKRSDGVTANLMVETAARHLWGPAWTPLVGEEDRC